MKVIVITQARSGSTRLPKKVLLEVQGKSLLQIHIDRIKKAKLVDAIYIATTINESDDIIVDVAKQLNVNYYRGSEEDVLDRFYNTAKATNCTFIVRLTSDCPLIDPQLLDDIIEVAKSKDLDYYSNVFEERYPDGQDIEVFKFSALEKTWKEATLKSDREHVTLYIRNSSTYKHGNLFTSDNHNLVDNFSHVRLTVDEQADFEVIDQIITDLGLDKDWRTYSNYYISNEHIQKLNNKIVRNEGLLKSLKND